MIYLNVIAAKTDTTLITMDFAQRYHIYAKTTMKQCNIVNNASMKLLMQLTDVEIWTVKPRPSRNVKSVIKTTNIMKNRDYVDMMILIATVSMILANALIVSKASDSTHQIFVLVSFQIAKIRRTT